LAISLPRKREREREREGGTKNEPGGLWERGWGRKKIGRIKEASSRSE
jgi:hypothetical protein